MITFIVGALVSAPVGILPAELDGLKSEDRSYLLAEVATHVERITEEKPVIGDFAKSPSELSASTGAQRIISVSMVQGAALVRISLQLHEASGARRSLQFDAGSDRSVWGPAVGRLVQALLLDRGAAAATTVAATPASPSESNALLWGGLALGTTGLAVGTVLRVLANEEHGAAELYRERQREATSRPEWEMLDAARAASAASGARLGTASNVTLVVSAAVTAALASLLWERW